MAYISKTWEDADFEFPTRYILHKTDLSQEQVTIENDWGDGDDGDVFDANTMNNLESRINAGFADATETKSGSAAPTSADGKNGDIYCQTATEGGSTSVVGLFVKLNGTWLEIQTGGAALPQAEGSGF